MSRHFPLPLLRLSCAALLVTGLLGPALAHAQDAADGVTVVDPLDIPPEHDPLAHAFDRPRERGGLYLRLSSSIGVHNTRLGPAAWEGNGRHARGFGSGFGLDVGALVAPWLAVHANATLGVLWNGDVREEAGIAGTTPPRARVLAYGVAPAATFFTPHDFRITTAMGVGMATVKQRDTSDTTNPGFYMDLIAGRDIVVSRNFAIGLQFQVVYMLLSNDANHDDARVRQFLFGMSGAFDSI